jgi:hypothetical protein
MPTIRDIARTVITTHWDLPGSVFDMLWDEINLGDVSYDALIASPKSFLQPALAHDGAAVEPVTVAVVIIRGVAQGITADTPLGSLGPVIMDLARRLGHEGTGAEIVLTIKTNLNQDTIVAPFMPPVRIVADAYTHHGKHKCTEQQAAEYKAQKAAFIIFIHDYGNADRMGEVYVAGEDAFTPKSTRGERRHLTPLEYKILRYLLKHENDHHRELPDLLEHCWGIKKTAQQFRDADKTTFHLDAGKYRPVFTELKKVLLALGCGYVRSVHRRHQIHPWPASYCVLDERRS